jgi:hypothetical protein
MFSSATVVIAQFRHPPVDLLRIFESGKRPQILLERIPFCPGRAQDGLLIFDNELNAVHCFQPETAPYYRRDGDLCC